ncbi:hypothetical protein RvY_03237 [Ramazzottius varieornatus]|uniref:Endonuclease/exonuclease/phosphatase domain-containing protein n=1 Tax=Ramazzottius varieornatus TaxID=947166 RepID=A0A1D1UMC0_RAMVA|nr:hypothetical protein RvY_03237 [Ramazzottius varieornatus]
MAILQVVSLALVCIAVQAAPPAGGPGQVWADKLAEGQARPFWAALKEKLGTLNLAGGNRLPAAGPNAWHSGRPLWFNHHRPGQHGPGGKPEGPGKKPEGPAKKPEGPAKKPEGLAGDKPESPAKKPEGPAGRPEGPAGGKPEGPEASAGDAQVAEEGAAADAGNDEPMPSPANEKPSDNSEAAPLPAQAPSEPANSGGSDGPQQQAGQGGRGPQGDNKQPGAEGRPDADKPAARPVQAPTIPSDGPQHRPGQPPRPEGHGGPHGPKKEQGAAGAAASQAARHPFGFGPPVIKHINSPEEAGAQPVAPQKQHRWAKKSTAAPTTAAPPAPAPALVTKAAAAAPAAGKGSPLRICTWNIFRFGMSKFAAEPMATFKKAYGKDKLEMITEQVQNADIIAIQEYFDTTEAHEVMMVVTDYLNKTTGSKWGMSVGPRVGRGSKEQYVFLYRTELASVMKEAVAPEPAESKDPYSREPWFTQFKISKPGFSLPTLTLGTIHTEPEFAVREMNALDVYTWPWAESTFGTKDVMVLGDYNADCQYVRKSDWDSITLFTKKDYTWFIPTGTDTAAMSSECTFDRAVTRSPKIQASFVPGSLKVLDFVSQYKIPVATARQLSDHFPVCMEFK